MISSHKHCLLIDVPSRKGKGGKDAPLGLLYVGGIIERCGHIVKIYDPWLNDNNLTRLDRGDYTELDVILKEFHPDIVGFGGIASSYGRTKKLSCHIKEKYPGVLQIAGGPLASVYKLLLQKTNVNLVFHGETERTLPLFLERYCAGLPYLDTLGISTINPNGFIRRNPLAPQIENIDEIPFPAYHLIDLKAYNLNKMHLVTSRGCTNKCSFCYRHMKGHRQNSVPYLISHIKFSINTFGFKKFIFGDELFNTDRQWVLDFCDTLEREKMTISFITSMRADKVDEFMLKRLKEVGCTGICYGQESGSDTILKEYRKGVDAKTNTKITLLTRKQGLKCPIQIVIGSPSETPVTIQETTDFLISLGGGLISMNYLIPFPETPIWDYVERNHLIPDVENYLNEIADGGGYTPIINLTQIPDNIWRTWNFKILSDVKLATLKKERKILKYTLQWYVTKILWIYLYLAPKKLILLKNRLR